MSVLETKTRINLMDSGHFRRTVGTLARFGKARDDEVSSVGAYFNELFTADKVQEKKAPELMGLIRKYAIDSAVLINQVSEYISGLSSKDKTEKSTASWWHRFILKELKNESVDADNTLGGATGCWSLTTGPNLLTPNGLFDQELSFEIFVGTAAEGFVNANERMLKYLEAFWEQLIINKLVPDEAVPEGSTKEFKNRFKLKGDLWPELLGKFGAIPTIGSDGKERFVHLKDPALATKSTTRKEIIRSPDDLKSMRIIVYSEVTAGKWQAMNKIVKFTHNAKLNVAAEVNTLIENPDQGEPLTDNDSRSPVFEVAVVMNRHQQPDQFRTPEQLDLSGVAARSPSCRLVINYEYGIGPDRKKVGKVKNISTVFPHYSANEDTGRDVFRQILDNIKREYKTAEFRRSSDSSETKVIRRDINPKNKKIDTLEVSSQFQLSDDENSLIRLARAAHKKSLPEEDLKKGKVRAIGFAQLLSLVTSTITEQPTLMCVAPELADLQIALPPNISDTELLRHINFVLAPMFDHRKKPGQLTLDNWMVVLFNNPELFRTAFTSEFSDFAKYSGQQITDGIDSMALPALLDTHTKEFSQKLMTVVLKKEAEFIQNSMAQNSSVFHDLDRDGAEMDFVTALSEFSTMGLGLTSNSNKEKFINLRHRYKEGDLKELQANDDINSEQLERRAIEFTEELLKKKIRIRLIMVSVLIAVVFSEKEADLSDIKIAAYSAMESALK